MEWYYEENQQPAGPVSDEKFRELVKNGTIVADTLVWKSDMADWAEYRIVAAQSGQADGESPALREPRMNCSECGGLFSQDEMIQYEGNWVCATCKPIFIQKIKEGVSLDGHMDYGGFWIRFGAKIIDGLIIGAIQMVIFLPMMFMMMPSMVNTDGQPPHMGGLYLTQALLFLLHIAYPTFFVGKFAATPGKMVCKLKVVTADGGRVSYSRALGRVFAEWISAMILMIGYLMAAFDGQKRALHDHICSTRVVRKQ